MRRETLWYAALIPWLIYPSGYAVQRSLVFIQDKVFHNQDLYHVGFNSLEPANIFLTLFLFLIVLTISIRILPATPWFTLVRERMCEEGSGIAQVTWMAYVMAMPFHLIMGLFRLGMAGRLLGLILTLGLLGSGGYYAYNGPLRPWIIQWNFPVKQLHDYQNALIRLDDRVAVPLGGGSKQPAERHGKVLIVNVDRDHEPELNPSHFSLPENIRAASPAEVQTVVLVNFNPKNNRVIFLAFEWPSKKSLGREVKDYAAKWTEADIRSFLSGANETVVGWPAK